jgi:dynein heavy chain
VSSIVGPPYAIVKVEPHLGPVTGNQKIEVYGVGFLSTPGPVTVRFCAANGKQMAETQGTVINDELIECRTPNAASTIGPCECEVRLSIGIRDFTTTMVEYLYYLNTVAEQSLCYGPGLLESQQTGEMARFTVQSRNALGANRKSGRDDWSISIHRQVHSADNKHSLKEINFEVSDHNNGQYEVKYMVNMPCEILIHVKLSDENNKQRPTRGSPFKPTFVTDARHRANEYTGPNVSSWLVGTLKQLEEFYRTTESGQSVKPKENDVKGLIKVMNHIKDMYTQEGDLIRKQDEIHETLAHLEREGIPNEKQLKLLKKIGSNLMQLKSDCQLTEKAIQPMVLLQSEQYKKKIALFEQELKTYMLGLKKESYYYYSSGLELAFRELDRVKADLDVKTQEMEDLLHIARNFDYPDELNNSYKIMAQMREDLANIRGLWQHELNRIKLTEKYLVTKWGDVRPTDMEDEVKAAFKALREVKVDKRIDAHVGISEVFKRWIVFCPLVNELHDFAMRPRHWEKLMDL